MNVLTNFSLVIQVHGSESDIDALCIGPFFATITVSSHPVPLNGL